MVRGFYEEDKDRLRESRGPFEEDPWDTIPFQEKAASAASAASPATC
jgi:hypothetical protein